MHVASTLLVFSAVSRNPLVHAKDLYRAGQGEKGWGLRFLFSDEEFRKITRDM
jgi:hypothetical protein